MTHRRGKQTLNRGHLRIRWMLQPRVALTQADIDRAVADQRVRQKRIPKVRR